MPHMMLWQYTLLCHLVTFGLLSLIPFPCLQDLTFYSATCCYLLISFTFAGFSIRFVFPACCLYFWGALFCLRPRPARFMTLFRRCFRISNGRAMCIPWFHTCVYVHVLGAGGMDIPAGNSSVELASSSHCLVIIYVLYQSLAVLHLLCT